MPGPKMELICTFVLGPGREELTRVKAVRVSKCKNHVTEGYVYLALTVCLGMIIYFCKSPFPLLDDPKQIPLGVMIRKRHRLSSTDQN